MSLESVLQPVAAVLMPCLPYLVKYGTEAAEEIVKDIGSDTWSLAKKLWSKLSGKLQQSPAAWEVVEDIAKSPEDGRAQAMLEYHLQKVLQADAPLADELAAILASTPAGGVTAGQRGIATGGNVSNSVFITGDSNTVHPDAARGRP